MSDRFIVYGLRDPRTLEIRYVGKTKRGIKRAYEHLDSQRLKSQTHKNYWIRQLLSLGLTYDVVLLEIFDCEQPLDEAERRWIAAGRAALGDRLTNGTDGGDGLVNPSQATRQKLAAAQRLRRGEKRSQVSKERLSAATRALWSSDEFRTRQREGVRKWWAARKAQP